MGMPGAGGATAVAAALLAVASLAGCGGDDGAASAAGQVGARVAAPPSATPSPTPTGPANVFPIKAAAGKITYGRAHHDYPATDIFAPCGSPVLAPAAGEVVEVSTADAWKSGSDDGGDRGGISWSIAGADGVRYYGSHLASLAATTKPGAAVTAGQVLGVVGRTGSAAGTPCHLHFGLSPICGPGDWWTRRGVVPPYGFLKAWQKAKPRSPSAEVQKWQKKNGCPKSPKGLPEP